MVRDAWWLTRKQWAYTKFGFVFTIVFYALYGGLAGMFSGDWFTEAETLPAILIDIVLLVFMSMNGFVFSKGYFNNPYWKTDSFTKQLAMLRSLPIPVESLAMSRSLQVAIMSPITTMTFFTVFYFASEWARGLPLGTFILFALVWFSFGNSVSCWFVIEEWSRSGKRYLINSCVVTLSIIAGVIAITLLGDVHLFAELKELVGGPGGWLWAVLALALAVAAHAWMQLRLRRILLRRDFA